NFPLTPECTILFTHKKQGDCHIGEQRA
ncbi:hypothetical protein CP8484711_1978B, partial [Chlamydia psittaci 84-8471/1]